ncbi:MAG: hypothetical protein WC607_04710 [Candidatus Micrarchaeia archaeon]
MAEDLTGRYPFLAAARKSLRDAGVSARDLDEAKTRVRAALERKPVLPAGGNAARDYALDRLLVFALDDSLALKRYARETAKAYARRLADEEDEGFKAVARELLPSLADDYSVGVLDFITNAGNLAGEDVSKGRVLLGREGAVRLLRYALETRLLTYSGSRAKIPAEVTHAASELKPLLSAFKPARLFKGSLYALPCIQRIRAGVPEGKRYYGAMALAIALNADGAPRERALAELEDYAERCGKGTDEFSKREAHTTVDWIYKHPGIMLSCRTLESQGLANEAECAKCARRRFRRT